MSGVIAGSEDLVMFDTKLSTKNRDVRLLLHTRGQIDIDIYDSNGGNERFFYGSITMYMKSDKDFSNFINYLYQNKEKICEEIKENQRILDLERIE